MTAAHSNPDHRAPSSAAPVAGGVHSGTGGSPACTDATENGAPAVPKRKFWTDAEFALLKELGEAGIPFDVIAQRLGRTHHSVRVKFFQSGFERVKTAPRKRLSPRSNVERMRELWLSGLSFVEIAKEMGCSDNTVSARLRQVLTPEDHAARVIRPKRTFDCGKARREAMAPTVAEMFRAGVFVHAIAAHLGCSREMVRRVVDELGLTRPRLRAKASKPAKEPAAPKPQTRATRRRLAIKDLSASTRGPLLMDAVRRLQRAGPCFRSDIYDLRCPNAFAKAPTAYVFRGRLVPVGQLEALAESLGL